MIGWITCNEVPLEVWDLNPGRFAPRPFLLILLLLLLDMQALQHLLRYMNLYMVLGRSLLLHCRMPSPP